MAQSLPPEEVQDQLTPHMDATVNGKTAQTHSYLNRTISHLKLVVSNSRMPRCLTAYLGLESLGVPNFNVSS